MSYRPPFCLGREAVCLHEGPPVPRWVSRRAGGLFFVVESAAGTVPACVSAGGSRDYDPPNAG